MSIAGTIPVFVQTGGVQERLAQNATESKAIRSNSKGKVGLRLKSLCRSIWVICLPFDNLLSKKLVMNFGCNVKIYFLFSGDPLETLADAVLRFCWTLEAFKELKL